MTQPILSARSKRILLVFSIFISILESAAASAPARQPEEILRVEGHALLSPVFHFRGQYAGQPVELDIIGVIHFARNEYYDLINHLLAGYDAVGVELIVPRGTNLSSLRLKPPEARVDFSDLTSIISFLQAILTKQLGLTSQLAAIDYRQKHLTLADIDAETLRERLDEEPLGEAITTGDTGDTGDIYDIYDIVGIFLDLTSPKPRADLLNLAAAFAAAKDRRLTCRRLLAEFFVKNTDALELVPFRHLLIEERDRIAVDCAEEFLNRGNRRVALLYGAAHLRDLSERVIERFDFTFAGADWLTVWAW